MDVFETLAEILKPDNNPFSAKNQDFKKSVKPENCNANYHNYGVKKYGFCANCNGTELKLKA